MYILLFLSILLAFSSPSFFFFWITMEINTFCFIPVIYSNNPFNKNHLMKYFIIQTFASNLFIMSCFSNFFNDFNNIFMIICLLIKLGIMPFHNWFIQMTNSINFLNLIILLTLQKIIPLSLMNNFFYNMPNNLNSLNLIILLNLILSSVFLFSLENFKKIIAMSSINHLSWMMLAMINNHSWFSYWLTYSLITLFGLYLLLKSNTLSLSQTINFNQSSAIFLIFFFLVMSGIPPFLGFFLKWMIIQTTEPFNLLFLISMTTSSLISCFFYLRCCFNLFSSMNFSKLLLNPQLSMTFFSINISMIFLYPSIS